MKFEIDEEDLKIIYQILGEIPLKFSGPVFSKLQESVKQKEPVHQNHSDKPL